jgi:uncharacterized membrane protein YcaP (DUF421 family)
MEFTYEKLEQFWNALFDVSEKSLFLIICSSIGIYVAVILFTRIFGKRSFSKLSSFDFAMTVAVGSIIATTVLSDSVSLADGAIGLLMVYSLQLSAAFMRRYNWFRRLIDNQPTLLMDGEVLLKDNMKSVRVTEGDIRSKLRESNVTQLSEIKAVIFETTGDIVVIHKEHDKPIEDWIMEDVKR